MHGHKGGVTLLCILACIILHSEHVLVASFSTAAPYLRQISLEILNVGIDNMDPLGVHPILGGTFCSVDKHRPRAHQYSNIFKQA